MLSLREASLVVLARAYYGGYKRVVLERPTADELPLLQGDLIEAIPICTNGRCEFNDKAAGHVCKYELCWEREEFPDRDCYYEKYYLQMSDKVKYRISATNKGRAFFEEGVSRAERIYLLLEMKEWRWALSEINKLTVLELPEFLSHERRYIRRAADARLNTLTVLGRVSKVV